MVSALTAALQMAWLSTALPVCLCTSACSHMPGDTAKQWHACATLLASVSERLYSQVAETLLCHGLFAHPLSLAG
jgi:hypothetical protein